MDGRPERERERERERKERGKRERERKREREKERKKQRKQAGNLWTRTLRNSDDWKKQITCFCVSNHP